MGLCWVFQPRLTPLLGLGGLSRQLRALSEGWLCEQPRVKHINAQTPSWAPTPLSLGPSLAVWRHVDKGTPEGAIDAMLIHGQGEGLPGLLGCGAGLRAQAGPAEPIPLLARGGYEPCVHCLPLQMPSLCPMPDGFCVPGRPTLGA